MCRICGAVLVRFCLHSTIVREYIFLVTEKVGSNVGDQVIEFRENVYVQSKATTLVKFAVAVKSVEIDLFSGVTQDRFQVWSLKRLRMFTACKIIFN